MNVVRDTLGCSIVDSLGTKRGVKRKQDNSNWKLIKI